MINANLLRAAIAREGLTQGELARRIGMSANTLSSKILGRGVFNVDEIEKICGVLNINNTADKAHIFLSNPSQKWDK